jgi:hypothetical protein
MITQKKLQDNGFVLVEDGYDLLSDWVVVEKNGRRFIWFFSTGKMWDIEDYKEIDNLSDIVWRDQ